VKAPLADVAEWLCPELCLLEVEARDGGQVLDFAAHAMATAHGLDTETVAASLRRREQMASTALEGGFAIPHARIAGLARPTTAFLRTRAPLPFRAPDGRCVSDFLVVLVPQEGDREDHLRLLALVASLLQDPAFRRDLSDAAGSHGVARAFLAGATRAVVRGDVR
jgi:PTS system nitrogen regulatory IIA component